MLEFDIDSVDMQVRAAAFHWQQSIRHSREVGISQPRAGLIEPKSPLDDTKFCKKEPRNTWYSFHSVNGNVNEDADQGCVLGFNR